jgi:hypothetical protein
VLLRVLYDRVSFHFRIPVSGGGNHVNVGNPCRCYLLEVSESFVVRVMRREMNKRSLTQS